MALAASLSFAAGALTTLSPCVLPILPMLLGSSLHKNKFTPALMVLGLMMSFTVTGVVLSRFGSEIGLNSNQLRMGSAIMLLIVGGILLSQKLQDFAATKLSWLASFGSKAASRYDETKPVGALVIGGLLGVIWSPCVGPTLGIAITLAGQEGGLLDATIMMALYALGAGIPMLGIAYGSKKLVSKYRPGLLNFAEKSKKWFGIILLISGIIVVTGFDKNIESKLIEYLPEFWINALTYI